MPPHSTKQGEELVNLKIEEMKNSENRIEVEKGFWDSFKPRAKVVITGESVNLMAELETLFSFIQLEGDPVRRSALIELAMGKKGVDITGLPKTEQPQQPVPVQQTKLQPQVA